MAGPGFAGELKGRLAGASARAANIGRSGAGAWPARAAWACLLLALAALFAAPAQAEVLLSNLSHTDNASLTVGTLSANRFTQAAKFNTGSNEGGYTLTSVKAVLEDASSSDGVRVRIFSATAGGNPDSSVQTLQNPTISNATLTFTAQAGASLAKGTDYFVVFDSTAAGETYKVRGTSSTAATTGAAGWGLFTSRYFKNSDSGNWSTNSTARPRIEINGTAATSTDATLSALTVEDEDSNSITLSPTFAAATTAYTAFVDNDVDSVTLTATKNDDGATVVITDDDDTSTAGEADLDLDVGANTLTVTVTAADGNTTETYTVTVARAAAAPTADADAVWTANLTVGTGEDKGNSFTGYQFALGGTSWGALAPATFEIDSKTLGVTGFQYDSTDLLIALSPIDPGAAFAAADYELQVGGQTFDIAATPADLAFDFPSPGLSWSFGDVVLVKLFVKQPDATLSALALEDGDSNAVTLSPAFDAATTGYTASVANTVSRITVEGTPNDADADVKYLDGASTELTDADTDATGFQIDLGVSANTIKVKVIAEDSATTKTYTVVVTRAASSAEAALVSNIGQNTSAEGIVGGTGDVKWGQGFTAGPDKDYFLTKVTLQVDAGGNLRVAIHAPAAGNASIPRTAKLYNLIAPASTSAGRRTFTAPAGAVLEKGKSYFVVASGPVGNRDINLTDSNAETGLTGWSINDTGVNRPPGGPWGTETRKVKIEIKGDPIPPSTDATLSALALKDSDGNSITLSPLFDTETTSYTASVALGSPRITVDATANDAADAAVKYFDGSDAERTDADGVEDGFQVYLHGGANTIKVEVTAEDGDTTGTYTVVVTRAEGTILVSSLSQTNDDAGTVGGGTNRVQAQKFTLAPNQEAVLTDVRVGGADGDGVTVAIREPAAGDANNPASADLYILARSGADSGDGLFTAPPNAALTQGASYFVFVKGPSGNTEDVNFTDSDNQTGETGWTIADSRRTNSAFQSSWTGETDALRMQLRGSVSSIALATDATLSALSLEDADSNTVTLSPAFAAATTAYTASVANDVDSVTLTATKNDDGATVVITDDDDTSTAGEADLDLDVGANTLTVTVTAEDGNTTETYTVVVTRASATTGVPSNWALKPSALSAGDSFRLLFLSSTTRKAGSTDIAVYNTWVQERAAAGHADIQGYSAGFRAVGCTTAVDARDNTATTYTASDKGVPIYWLNGNKLADDYEDFYDGGWDDEANDKNESGTNGPDTSDINNRPFTGCDHDGTEDFDGPDSRALGASGGLSTVGRPNDSASNTGPLSSPSIVDTGLNRPVYGLSAVFEVSSVSTTDATLSALTLEDADSNTVTLSPAFAAATTAYTASVANDVDSVTLTATKNDDGATVVITDDDDTSTAGEADLDLDVGANTLTVTVTAGDGNTTETYTVVVTRRAAATAVPSNWGLKPSALSTGDSFRLLFLSSDDTDGDSTDIGDYNTFVQNLAAAGHADIQAHSAGFRVVGSTAAVDARDNTATTYTADDKGVPIYWLNGAKAADDYEDFYDGSWDNEANDKNESGNNGPNTNQAENWPHTGSGHNGTEFFDGGTSRALGEGLVKFGRPNSSTSGHGPLSNGDGTGEVHRLNTRPVYALSAVFEVSSVAATAPGTPTGLLAQADGQNQIKLSWTAPADTGGAAIRGYKVEASADGGTTWTNLAADTGTNDTDYSHTGLSAGAVRHYRVSAINSVGTGPASDVASAITATSDATFEVPANWSLKPGVVLAGGSFRLLFLSSGKRTTGASNIDSYNTFIHAQAANGHSAIQVYGSHFGVVGCTAAVDARDNTATTYTASDKGVPIYWLNGAKAADDYEDFYDGSWDNEADDTNESGNNGPNTSLLEGWPATGCAHNGTEAFDISSSRALGASQSRLGRPNSTTSGNGPLSSTTNSGNSSNLNHMYGLSPVFSVPAPVNNAATGQPGIDGAPQSGQQLTATKGDIDDDDGEPADFPGDYTFKWFQDGTEIGGETNATLDVDETHVGAKLTVQVSFTDDANNPEGPLVSAETAAVVAKQEDCATDRPDNNWCTTMTVARNVSGSNTFWGYSSFSSNTGALDNATIMYGGSSIPVFTIQFGDRASNDTFGTELNSSVPSGTKFDFGGTELTADSNSEQSTGTYSWTVSTDPGWFVDQKVTVSANLAPIVTNATVVGDELVLTFAEDLDTNSKPAASAFSVTVDSGTAAAPSSVDTISAKTVTMTLASAVTSGQTVTVGYTVPTSNPLQDESELEAPAFSGQSVTNDTITTANNAPTFATASATRSVAENTAAGQNVGAAVTATDDDGDTLAYTLEGTDAASFDIVSGTGQIQTKSGVTYDHEAKSSYSVTVKADDSNGGTDTIAVTISVTDVNEPPAAPAAPTLAPVSGDDTKLQMTWTAPDNTGRPSINAYNVRYREGSGGNWVGSLNLDPNNPTTTLTGLTAGTEYQAQVNAANSEGVGDWSPSGTGSTGSPTNNPATGVALDGAAQVGMTLTALTADIEDADGLTGATFAYQWRSGADDIAGATGSTYTVREADIGKNVRVQVSFTDDANNDEAPTKSTRRKVVPAASDNCDAQTVWCATLTAGVSVEEVDGVLDITQAGYRPTSGYGSLAPLTFTHGGVEYTVTELRVGSLDLYFTTTPNLPADGADLTLHVQRVVGEVSLPFSDGVFQSGSEDWYFERAVNTSVMGGDTFEDLPLLVAPFARDSVESQPTEEGTEVAVRLSAVPEEDVGGVLVSNLGQATNTIFDLASHDFAQGFVTGAAPGGYTMTAIDLTVTAGVGQTFGTATLHRDDTANAAVATLTAPAEVAAAGTPRLTAPAGTVLDPDSTYFLLLDGGDADLLNTSAGAEDADGLPDWEILDVVHFRAHDSTGALAEGNANPLLIRVYGTVNPDPGAPTAGFAQSTYSVNEGRGFVDIEVVLSVAQGAAVTIPITATPRNGATSADYTGVDSSVTFAAGETSKTFTVLALDDTDDDDGENVLLELGTLPQGLAAGIASTVIEIEDDDGPAPASGQLRLMGGPDRFEGRLEVFFRGQWGSTCDDRFFEPSGGEENRAPDVACKLLGFKSGAQAAGYGRPHLGVTNEHNRNAPRFAENEPIWLDDVRCLASMPTHNVDNPRSIFDCYYAGPGLHNCTHEEDVGLRCSNTDNATEDLAPGAVGGLIVSASGSDGLTVLWQVPAGPAPTGYDVEYRTTGGNWADWSHSGVGTTTTITGLDPATDYEVRVRGTNADGEGDWSPTGSGRTGPASGQQGAALTAWFEDVPASHDGMAKLTLTLKFSAPITTRVRTLRTERLVVTNATLNWVRRVDRGAEGTSAFTMRITPAGAATVTVSLPADGIACDAGGVCTADGVQLGQGATATVPGPGAEVPDAPSAPTLTAGTTWLEASWTAPDDNGSAITDYDVHYRESGGNWTDASHAGTATTKRIDGLAAETDYEVRVRASNAEGTGDWSPAASGRTTAAAGAAEGDVRLVGGSTAQEGRVEIYHDGAWGTVCDDYFASDDAAVVCRQLGYTGGEAHAARSTFGVGTGRIWMDDVQCTGSESRLADCPFAGWGIENCRHSEDVGVSCGSGMSLTRAMVSGTELTLRYDRPLDGGSVPSPGDFVVAAASSDSAGALPIDAVAVIDGAAVLSLSRVIEPSEILSVSYLPAPMHPLQDASLNPAPAFTGHAVLHAPALAPVDVAALDEVAPAALPAALPAPLLETGTWSQAKVEVLDLSAHRLADLSALSGLADLQTLDLGGNRVADLGPLAALAGLERLDLRANAVADLAPLGALAHLRVLDLSGNAVTDVSPLAALTALRRLNLSGNRVTDLRPLSELHGLEVLLLGGNEISNLVPLWGLTELAHLGLGDNRIADAALLRELRALQRLDLAGNRLRDTSVLGDLPHLVWLHLAGNPIADFAPLGRLTAMRWLVLDAGASPLQAVPEWPGGERAPLILIETRDGKTSEGL